MRCPTQPEFVDFYPPFGGKLRADNRWVKLAGFVPWDLVEERYGSALAGTGMGAPPLPERVAFGALVIKERVGITDEEAVEQVFENAYLQYFLGYRELLREEPFDAIDDGALPHPFRAGGLRRDQRRDHSHGGR